MAMVTYVVRNLAGKAVRTGICDEKMLDLQPFNDDEKVEICTPEALAVGREENEIPIYNHTHPRMVNYPDLRDQVDMLWKIVAENCTLTPEQKIMLDRIKAVKDSYSKEKKYVQRADGTFVPYNGE